MPIIGMDMVMADLVQLEMRSLVAWYLLVVILLILHSLLLIPLERHQHSLTLLELTPLMLIR